MALNIKAKKAIVADVSAIAQSSVSALTAYYIGLNVSQMTELRSKARDNGVKVKVVPNTLARRALADTALEPITETLTGPNVFLFSKEDPGAAARVVRDFIKDNETLKVNSMVLDGQLLGADQLKAVAALPTYNEGISLLMSVMLAPVTKLVRTMAEPYAMCVRTMAAVRDQKQ